MAIEFHNLAVVDVQFERLLDSFSKDFYISHIHGCNFSKLIYKTDIPSVLELTFIHKKLVPEAVVWSNQTYPLAGLDAPNNRFKADYTLVFPPPPPPRKDLIILLKPALGAPSSSRHSFFDASVSAATYALSSLAQGFLFVKKVS
jgi:hypothetical protein